MINRYVAIDLGSSRISAMAAEVQADGALKILAVESKAADDVKHGIVDQVSGAAYKVNEVLKLLQNSAKLPTIEQVSVSIGGRTLKTHTVEVNHFVDASKIVSEQLLANMHEEAGTKINGENITVYDVIPLYYELDGLRLDEPSGKKGTQITGKYTVVFGNRLVSESIDRCFDRTGINVDHLPLAIEALSAAVLEEDERETCCALINFGAATTTLGIYHEGTLRQLIVVPLGGKNITRDIMELGIAEAHAEKLKCLKGSALVSMEDNPVYIEVASTDPAEPPVKISTEFLATIIEARLDEITQPIFKAIEAFPKELEGGLVITGGGARLKNIIEFINERTGTYARQGTHVDWLIETNDKKMLDPILAQLAGTILLNHEHRLLHPIEEKKKKKVKEPKIPGRKFSDRITTSFINFFGDDNSMN